MSTTKTPRQPPGAKVPGPSSEPEDVGRLAVERRVLTQKQLQDCVKILNVLEERFGLRMTLGQVILERVYASNPKTRPTLSRPGGVQEILGPGVHVDFVKIPKASHDSLLDRIEKAGLVPAERMKEAVTVREELAKLGIVKRLGEILILRGYIDRAMVEECMRPAPDLAKIPAFAFARIAVHNGLITERDATDALELSDQVAEELGLKFPIGQIFYELGILRRREVEAILDAQVEMGRLRPEEARIQSLKLTAIERARLHDRLIDNGYVDEPAWAQALELARNLHGFGLEFDPVEVLWIRNQIPESAIADILEFQSEAFARLDPDSPNLSLSVAPSAEWLARQRPPDMPETDYLFGQFALVAGAVQREELDWATNAVRRLRTNFGDGYTVERALFDRFRHDARRLRLLERARRELARFQGLPYQAPQVHLSPIEKEILRDRMEKAGLWTEEDVGKVIGKVWLLAELGIEKDITELLIEEGIPSSGGKKGWDLVPGRDESNQKMIGAWRRSKSSDPGLDRVLFERAFTKSTSDWGTNHLGTLALEAGLLAQAQLVEALHVQLQTRELGLVKPFGEILVEKGFLSAEELANLLRLQEQRLSVIKNETEPPETKDLVPEDETLVHRIRALGVISDERLREALRIRRQLQGLGLRGSLKEILIRRGYLDPEIVGTLLLDEPLEKVTTKVTRRMERVRSAGGITTALRIQDAYARTFLPHENPGQATPAPAEAAPPASRAALVLYALGGVAVLGVGWLVAKLVLALLRGGS